MSLDLVFDETPLEQSGVCGGCGCTDDAACPGGCVWANRSATICSRCARGDEPLDGEELADLHCRLGAFDLEDDDDA